MKRRAFIMLVGGAVAWPFAGNAQQPSGVKRLAILMSVQDDAEGTAQLSGFTQALAGLGWVEGRNLQTEVRWGGGDASLARAHAKELVGLKPDVILAQGTPVTAALKRETQSIPIVFVVVTDPVGDGFVAGLPHPGGNITGFLTSEAAIAAKMLEFLKEITPGLKRVALLFNPNSAPGGGTYYSRDFDAAARLSKLELVAGRAYNDTEIEAVVTSLAKEPNGGLVVMPYFFMFNHIELITSLARQNRIPAVYPWKFVVTKNAGLLSYGPDLSDIVRRGAAYVDRVLRGGKPADLPVQVPVKFEMVINVKTAGALGLTVPPSMLLSADEVIE